MHWRRALSVAAQIKMLTGYTARPEFLAKVTWVCLNHHAAILMIDTVRAFHFGCNFIVEVDIVLPESMSVREAHDIAESLQRKIERMPQVERSFVHVDYECDHAPCLEHKMVWSRAVEWSWWSLASIFDKIVVLIKCSVQKNMWIVCFIVAAFLWSCWF